MVHHHPQDGHPPSRGWSSTIQDLPERIVLQTWNLAARLYTKKQGQVSCVLSPLSPGWSPNIPRMITHHLKSTGMKVYFRLGIWHINLTHKIRSRWSAMDGHPPSPVWSPTIPRMVTHHSKSTRRHWSVMDGQPPSPGWSPTIQNKPEEIVLQAWNLVSRID